MKSLILAAGRGSRMGSLTDEQPKCLTRLGGRALLSWQLDALSVAGLDPPALVTGYCAGELDGRSANQFHNARFSETNMVGSLLCARPWLEAPCVIGYADIVYHPSIPRSLAECSAPIAISYDGLWQSLWQQRFPQPLDDAETFAADDDGSVIEIGHKPSTLEEIEGQYMGLLKITPEGITWIDEILDRMAPSERDALDMTGLLQRLIAAGRSIFGMRIEGRWCEVDTESDLRCYAKRIEESDSWLHDWRW